MQPNHARIMWDVCDFGYSSSAAVTKRSEDTLIGAELVPKMLWLFYFKIKRAFRILRVLKKQSDKILYGFTLL